MPKDPKNWLEAIHMAVMSIEGVGEFAQLLERVVMSTEDQE